MSADPLILGLTAAGIADPVLEDRRDNLRVLAALNDAAGRVGRSLVDLVNTVRPVARWRGVSPPAICHSNA